MATIDTVSVDSVNYNLGGIVDLSGYITKSDLLNYVYPIGSVYMSFNSTSPASFLGGTWTQLTNAFLYASTSSGATGGSNTHTLTVNEMPSHTHTRGTMDITGQFEFEPNVATNVSSELNAIVSKPSGAFDITYSSCIQVQVSASSTPTWNHDHAITFQASNSWTGESSSTGGGQAFSTMPAYITVYMWRRTA